MSYSYGGGAGSQSPRSITVHISSEDDDGTGEIAETLIFEPPCAFAFPFHTPFERLFHIRLTANILYILIFNYSITPDTVWQRYRSQFLKQFDCSFVPGRVRFTRLT